MGKARKTIAKVPDEVQADVSSLDQPSTPGVKWFDVRIRLPLAPLDPNDYLLHRVYLNMKSQDQRELVKQLTRGLVLVNANGRSGRTVETAADTIRWLLEQVAKAKI